MLQKPNWRKKGMGFLIYCLLVAIAVLVGVQADRIIERLDTISSLLKEFQTTNVIFDIAKTTWRDRPKDAPETK